MNDIIDNNTALLLFPDKRSVAKYIVATDVKRGINIKTYSITVHKEKDEYQSLYQIGRAHV